MNLIPKICEMLGVEIGETFQIRKFCYESPLPDKFKFEDNKLIVEQGYGASAEGTLRDLLGGMSEIVKLPFEPKKGDKYYRIFIHQDDDLTVVCDTWIGWTSDYMCKYCGNCFRTEAEAEAHKHEIYEKLTGKKWEE